MFILYRRCLWGQRKEFSSIKHHIRKQLPVFGCGKREISPYVLAAYVCVYANLYAKFVVIAQVAKMPVIENKGFYANASV